MSKRPLFLNPSRRKKIKFINNCTHNFIKTNTSDNLRSIQKTEHLQSEKKLKMAIADGTDDESKSHDVQVEYLETPLKSESDNKDYRVIRLSNGLTALLISDSAAVNESNSSTKKNFGTDDVESYMEKVKKLANSLNDEETDESDTDGSSHDENGSEESDEENDSSDQENDSRKCEEKMAACGLCVGVGSFSDPNEIPGLAHFLEHMVFMGSKKFPKENEFDNFIKKKGGSNNASTDCEQTTFYFEIQEEYLYPALDRFAQFFIDPTMSREAISREREAVESEFKMALPMDAHRKEQLFGSFAKPNNPASKFLWGNIVTLRDNVDEDKLYKDLHQFRERHYSAHRMTLAIQARLPLLVLEQFVVDFFSNVPVNYLPPDDFSIFNNNESFDRPEFRKMYQVKPVEDLCNVELTWAMPSLLHKYKSKPHHVVSWIIGHEGKGSLISYLRKKMWCLDLTSGNGESGFEHNSMFTLFSLSLKLTAEGFKHLREVFDAIFSYLNLVRILGPQKRIFDEIQQVEKINFKFSEEEDPVEYVEEMCENMHFFPPVDYIAGSELYYEYDPESIQHCINSLRPDSVNIIVFDKSFNEAEFEKVEPWFQTKYSCLDIPEEWITKWKTIKPYPEFHLPGPNLFITDDFSLVDLPENIPEHPNKIYENDSTEIWYRVDSKFRLPECYIYLSLITPSTEESPKVLVMKILMIEILKHILAEEFYDAATAELNYELCICEKDIGLKIHGYNQKLPILLKKVLEFIAVTLHEANFHSFNDAKETLFNTIKKDIKKYFYNKFLKPDRLNKDVRLSILTTGLVTPLEQYAVIDEIDFTQFSNFSKHVMDHVYVKCLIQGNIKQEEALQIVLEGIKPLKCGRLLPKSYPKIFVHQLPQGEKFCRVKNFNPVDTNSVIINYYQCGLFSIKLSSIIDLFLLIADEPSFDQLRTKEQLGYNVHCTLRDTHGVLGYSVSVHTQATNFSAEHVDARIENFIKDMSEMLEKMSDNEFNSMKESLIKLKQCADIHLREEVDRNWAEMISDYYIFDRHNKEISVLRTLTLEELKQWLIDHSVNGANFKKLSVQVVGAAEENNCAVEAEIGKKEYSLLYLSDTSGKNKKASDFITDIGAFKSKLAIYRTHSKQRKYC